jgi:hypothetical protein
MLCLSTHSPTLAAPSNNTVRWASFPPYTCVASRFRHRRTQSPWEIKEVTADERHTSLPRKPCPSHINSSLMSPGTPVDDHDGFHSSIPSSRFCHGRLTSQQTLLPAKTIRRENQRYLPENTADSISPTVHGRPSSTTPSIHTHTTPDTPDTPDTLVTLSLLNSHLFDTPATPATPDTLVTLDTLEPVGPIHFNEER